MTRLALLLVLLAGCATQPPAPSIIVPSHDRGIDRGAHLWLIEASKRFDNPVIVAVHGLSIGDVWICYPDPPLQPMPVYAMAQTLRAVYGNRVIVLVCCNGGGADLTVPGVAYAKRIVWIIPRRYRVPRIDESDGAGRIDQFVTTTQPTQ